jgi:hypothetical protein
MRETADHHHLALPDRIPFKWELKFPSSAGFNSRLQTPWYESDCESNVKMKNPAND